MRTWLIAGLAITAGIGAAAAEQMQHRTEQRIIIRHGGMPGMDMNLDANHDGWVTRDEASAAADRMFADLDANHDGKLDETDHAAHHAEMEEHMDHGDLPAPPPEATGHGDHDVMIYRQERRVEGGDDGPDTAAPGHPPHPPHPPMFMMMLMNHEEFDANHDNALSRDEFRTMQLRFFDAADGNGDHRIKFEPPPEPPMPPEPPAAPQPPAPPAH
ncbi:MAG: hypothetical protein ABUS48_03685 [Pseudomonadota bacterium]